MKIFVIHPFEMRCVFRHKLMRSGRQGQYVLCRCFLPKMSLRVRAILKAPSGRTQYIKKKKSGTLTVWQKAKHKSAHDAVTGKELNRHWSTGCFLILYETFLPPFSLCKEPPPIRSDRIVKWIGVYRVTHRAVPLAFVVVVPTRVLEKLAQCRKMHWCNGSQYYR